MLLILYCEPEYFALRIKIHTHVLIYLQLLKLRNKYCEFALDMFFTYLLTDVHD